MTTRKKVILISLSVAAVGTAVWFIFIRTRNTVTDQDRKELSQLQLVEAPPPPKVALVPGALTDTDKALLADKSNYDEYGQFNPK